MKKTISSVLLVAFIVAALPTNSVHAGKKQGNLDLALNESDQAMNLLNGDAVQRGNKKYFNHSATDKKGNGRMNLDFNFTDTADPSIVHVDGKGVVYLNNRAYPITVDSELDKITLESGKVIYIGPAEANIKLGNQSQEARLGITYDPATNKSFVSLTVGAISEDGTGLLFFGTPLPETREILDKKKEIANVDLIPQVGSSTTPIRSDFTVAATSDYKYKTSANSFYLRWQNDQYSKNTGYSIVGLNVYALDPDVNGGGGVGSVYARAWSNSAAVINYVKGLDSGASPTNTTAYVDRAYISFQTSDSTGFININNAAPADSQPIQSYGWLAWIPRIGGILDMVANGAVALYNKNAAVTSTPQTDPTFNRTYYLRKNIKSLGKSTDYPNSSYMASGASEITNGGIQASFDYLEYASGLKTLQCGARMDYIVDDWNLYYGWFYSDAAVATWSANML